MIIQLKVLIVDDQTELCEMVSIILESENIKTIQVNNGQDALELLKDNSFDLVLCDIVMPNMSGLSCLAKATQAEITTPFIFIPGHSDTSKMLQAIRLGAVDFITKPFSNEEIVDVVFRVLEISFRKRMSQDAIGKENPLLLASVKKNEKMIALMRLKSLT